MMVQDVSEAVLILSALAKLFQLTPREVTQSADSGGRQTRGNDAHNRQPEHRIRIHRSFAPRRAGLREVRLASRLSLTARGCSKPYWRRIRASAACILRLSAGDLSR